LWKQQTELIMEKHGLMSFIVHPDYISGAREQSVYKELLTYLSRLRDEKSVWIPTSSEVNRWWRQRREMKLVPEGDGWRIEGEGNQPARIAYAREHDGQLVYPEKRSVIYSEKIRAGRLRRGCNNSIRPTNQMAFLISSTGCFWLCEVNGYESVASPPGCCTPGLSKTRVVRLERL
jgi:hypothetical protein